MSYLCSLRPKPPIQAITEWLLRFLFDLNWTEVSWLWRSLFVAGGRLFICNEDFTQLSSRTAYSSSVPYFLLDSCCSISDISETVLRFFIPLPLLFALHRGKMSTSMYELEYFPCSDRRIARKGCVIEDQREEINGFSYMETQVVQLWECTQVCGFAQSSSPWFVTVAVGCKIKEINLRLPFLFYRLLSLSSHVYITHKYFVHSHLIQFVDGLKSSLCLSFRF